MTDLEREIATLRERRNALDEVVADTSRDDGDRNTAVHASEAIAKKLLVLGGLRAKELAGETISPQEIDAALGRAKPETPKPVRRAKWTDAALSNKFEQVVETFTAVKNYVDGLQDEVEAVVKEIGKRLKALEARPDLKYCGTWDGASQFNEGNFVTHRGSLWACKAETRTEPGTSSDWQLAVKSGERRDAR